jgi:hypothetical protein
LLPWSHPNAIFQFKSHLPKSCSPNSSFATYICSAMPRHVRNSGLPVRWVEKWASVWPHHFLNSSVFLLPSLSNFELGLTALLWLKTCIFLIWSALVCRDGFESIHLISFTFPKTATPTIRSLLLSIYNISSYSYYMWDIIRTFPLALYKAKHKNLDLKCYNTLVAALSSNWIWLIGPPWIYTSSCFQSWSTTKQVQILLSSCQSNLVKEFTCIISSFIFRFI